MKLTTGQHFMSHYYHSRAWRHYGQPSLICRHFLNMLTSTFFFTIFYLMTSLRKEVKFARSWVSTSLVFLGRSDFHFCRHFVSLYLLLKQGSQTQIHSRSALAGKKCSAGFRLKNYSLRAAVLRGYFFEGLSCRRFSGSHILSIGSLLSFNCQFFWYIKYRWC